MSKILKRKCLQFAVYFLLLILPSQLLFSQEKYTVLLPEIDKGIPVESDQNLRIAADKTGNETAKSFFKFNFNYLPVHAQAGLLHLKLYVIPNSVVSEHSVQTVTVLKGHNNWTGNETNLNDANLDWAKIKNNKEGPIGVAEVIKNSEFITMKLKIPDSSKIFPFFLPDGILSLAARSPEKRQGTKFFSSATAEASLNFLRKPKLLVTYTIDPYPFRTDWAQPFANSQHNSFLGWQSKSYTTTAQVRKLPNARNEYIQEAGILIYKNQPVIFTQATTGSSTVFYVRQLNAKGAILWSAGVDAAAKCSPLIDEQGRLYYISTDDKLTLLDMNNKGTVLFSKSLSELSNRQIGKVNNTVTLGYDGTLYIPSDKGIFAVSAFPQLKIRWKYEQKENEINGPVSLSTDESKAFFINVDQKNERSQLIVLDNLDGSLIAASDYRLGSYANDHNYYIPAPVVQDNSRVFVLNGFDSGNKLFVFDINDKKEIKTQNIAADKGISQPVIDSSSNVYFVYNNKIAKYDALQNAAIVFDGSATLDNASILITDASSNIYAIDTYNQTQKKVTGIRNNSADPNYFANSFVVDINTDAVGNPRKKLALAPDGTLYTATATHVLSITPVTVAAETTTINLANLSTNTVYRASKTIIVEGIDIEASINTILNSGGSISFKSGLRVIKGAQLTCKTGF